MDRVTTFSAYNSIVANLMRAELRQHDAQVQVSSGKIADDLKGFAGNAEALTAAKTLKLRVEGFVGGAKALSAKLSAQDLALNQVADAGRGAREAIANAVATGRADGLMAALNSYFGQASAALNTQYNGQYLFSGGRVDTRPVAVGGMDALTPTPAGGFFQNDQLAGTARLDEATTVQYGMLADAIGQDLFDAFQDVQAFNEGGTGNMSGLLTQTQSDFLTSMLATFDAANQGMTDKVAANGLMQNRVTQAQGTQEDRALVLEVMIGGLTDVDVAEAASRLSQAQVALQASAHIFASLQDTSLLAYLD